MCLGDDNATPRWVISSPKPLNQEVVLWHQWHRRIFMQVVGKWLTERPHRLCYWVDGDVFASPQRERNWVFGRMGITDIDFGQGRHFFRNDNKWGWA